ncbi:hypothetical protein OK006_10095 [Actinobacteria bacterium OK006]|nr:hypothetical protein OK006_10095 [Actinobacteria bacterium OK006]
MPAYASSSQEPDGPMVSAIQQKYAAMRVSRVRGTASTVHQA